MKITLKTPEERKQKNQIIADKEKEGYMLINITEGFDMITSGTGGTQTFPSIILEFKKL